MTRLSGTRLVSGMLAGVALAMLVITVEEYLGAFLYPRPAIDWYDPDAVRRLMAIMPLSAKLLVVAGWLVGALAGAALAVAVTRRRWTGWVPAGAVLIGGIFNALAIDHPAWMDAGAVIAPLLGGALGILLGQRGRVHSSASRSAGG